MSDIFAQMRADAVLHFDRAHFDLSSRLLPRREMPYLSPIFLPSLRLRCLRARIVYSLHFMPADVCLLLMVHMFFMRLFYYFERAAPLAMMMRYARICKIIFCAPDA